MATHFLNEKLTVTISFAGTASPFTITGSECQFLNRIHRGLLQNRNRSQNANSDDSTGAIERYFRCDQAVDAGVVWVQSPPPDTNPTTYTDFAARFDRAEETRLAGGRLGNATEQLKNRAR